MLHLSDIRRHRWTAAAALCALILAIGLASTAAAPLRSAEPGWHCIDTVHFRVFRWRPATTRPDSSEFESKCEQTLTRLSMYWFGRIEPLDRKCDVVLYPSDASYLRAGGGSATQTAASVLTGYDGERAFFRIDLRGTRADLESNGLPHELTHVLFAQRFAGRSLPAWINEGTALLADPPLKQARHLRDFQNARASGTDLPLSQLLALTEYPRRGDWPTFYGESLALVKFLVELKSPRAFVEFVDITLLKDCDTALREVYNIACAGELQQAWSRYITQLDTRLAQGAATQPRAVRRPDLARF